MFGKNASSHNITDPLNRKTLLKCREVKTNTSYYSLSISWLVLGPLKPIKMYRRRLSVNIRFLISTIFTPLVDSAFVSGYTEVVHASNYVSNYLDGWELFLG